MKSIFYATLLLLLSIVPSSAEEPDAPVETFYQQVDIQRNPRFVVQGVNVNQMIHYQIFSSFDVYPPDQKGNRKAIQTIYDTKLVEADQLSQAVFQQSLAEMRGRKFTYQVDKFAELIKMEGHKDNTKVVDVQQPPSKGMLVSSVIDEDGWKELAQLTLFQPPDTGRPARSFVRKTTHDWGSLGSWYGATSFVGRSYGRSMKRFSYKHQLEYIAPDKDAAKANDPLPFQIDSAVFRLYEASGEIHYNEKDKRVESVREVFHARGSVSTTMLGVPTVVDVDEKQIFTIHVTGQRLLRIKTGREQSSSTSDE